MRSKKSFYKLISLVAGGLIIACTILSILLLQSGPRVRSITPTLDAQNQPTAKQQVVRVQFDRPIPQMNLKPFVTVHPAAEFDIRQEGQVIYITFNKNLQLGTEYSMTIKSNLPDVRGRQIGHDITYRFMSEPAELLYVERNYEALDRVVSYNPISKKSETIMEADTIIHLASNGSYLAIVQRDADNVDTVMLREQASGAMFKLTNLKPKSSISKIALSPSNQLAVVTPTVDKQASNELWRFAISGTQLSPVGQPTAGVMDIKYSHDGQVLVVKKTDGLYYLGPTTAESTLSLLGEFFSIGDFNHTNDKLLVETNTSVMVYDASAQKTLSLPELFGTDAKTPTFLHNSDDIAYRNYRAKPGTDSFETTVEVTRNKARDTTLSLQPKEYFLGDIAVSADDRYLAVQLATAAQLYDDYRLNAKPEGTVIRIFDRTTQQYLPEKLTGVDPIWR